MGSTLHHDFPALTRRLLPFAKRDFPPREVIPRPELGFDPPVPGGMFVPLRFVEWHKVPDGDCLTLSDGDCFTLLIGHDKDATVTGGCLVLTGREVHHDGPLGGCVRGRTPQGEQVFELFDPRRHVHLRPHGKPWEGPEPVNAHRLIRLIESETRRSAAAFDPTSWHEAVARCIERRSADIGDLPGIVAQWAPEFAWSLPFDWLRKPSTWERARARDLYLVEGILDVKLALRGDLDPAPGSLDLVAYDIAQIMLQATAHRARVKLDWGRTTGWSERIYLQERS